MKLIKSLLSLTLLVSTLFINANAKENNTIQRINPPTLVDSSKWGFSQVVIPPKNGRIVYISGQFAGDINGKITSTTMKGQIKDTFKNLKYAIQAAGAKPQNVLMMRMLIKDFEEKHVDYLYEENIKLFGKHSPASTLIPVPKLAIDEMLFEIEVTVFLPDE